MRLKKQKAPWVDPIVEELYQIRARMLAEVGGDPEAFYQRILQNQEKLGDRLSKRQPQKFVIPPDMLDPKSPIPPRP